MIDYTWSVEMKLGTVWTDLTSDVRQTAPISIERGIPGVELTDRVADVGRFMFALDNSTHNSGTALGYYAPDSPEARANFDLGNLTRMSITYNGTSYYKFYGKVDSVAPSWGMYRERLTEVSCVDYMNELLVHNMSLVPVQTSKRGDQLLGTIIANLPTAPLGTSYATGPDTFAYSLYDIQDEKSSGISAMQKVDISGLSYTFIKGGTAHGETLTWQTRNTRALIASTYTFWDSMTGVEISRKSDSVFSTVKGIGYPCNVGTVDEYLWYSRKEITLGTGGSIVFDAPYTDPQGGGRRISISPNTGTVGTANFAMSDTAGDGGTDLSDYLGQTITWGGNSANVTLANNTGGNDAYAVSLLHMDGADGGTVFTDENGRTWTPYGGAKLGTALYKFGTSAGTLDGTGDYLAAGTSADFDFGTANFTVDFWVYWDAAYGDGGGIVSSANSSGTGWSVYNFQNNILLSTRASGSWAVELAYGFTANKWCHIAVVRNGTVITGYVDGVSADTQDATGYTINGGGSGATIGRIFADSDSNYFFGNLDEVRISNGIARWTGNFTPPAAQYNTAAEGYVNLYRLKGKIIRTYDPVVVTKIDNTSKTTYGDRTLRYEMPYQDNVNVVDAFAQETLDDKKAPQTNIDTIEFIANSDAELMAAAMEIDVGSRITVHETATGITGDYTVNKYQLEIVGSTLKCILSNLQKVDTLTAIGIWGTDASDSTNWGAGTGTIGNWIF